MHLKMDLALYWCSYCRPACDICKQSTHTGRKEVRTQIRKELLAQVFGMEHNHHHVYVWKVILWADHKLLVSISWKPLASVFKRLQNKLGNASSAYAWVTRCMWTHFKELSPLMKDETVRVMPLPRDKSQTWFNAEIEELADVRSYKVKTDDGINLCRNRRHPCRSREPFYSSQPREAPVTLQPMGMAASPEKLQRPQPTEGQSFRTVPVQGDKSKQPTKTRVAISSKAHPLCTTLNKSQPVENRIARARRLSKPPGYLKDYAWLHLMIVGDSYKNGFFSLSFSCLDNEHFVFWNSWLCSKCSVFSALADVAGLSLVIKRLLCNEVFFLFSFYFFKK